MTIERTSILRFLIALFLTVALCLAAAAVPASAAGEKITTARSISILSIDGSKAYVNSGGKKNIKAVEGMKLGQGYKVMTGASTMLYVQVDKDKAIRLAAGTTVSISKASSKKLNITLVKGEIVFNFKSKLKDGESASFTAGGTAMNVRGTSGSASLIESDKTNGDNVDCAVQFNIFSGVGGITDSSSTEIRLEAGQGISVIIDSLGNTNISNPSDFDLENSSLFVQDTLMTEMDEIPDLNPDLKINLEQKVAGKINENLLLKSGEDEKRFGYYENAHVDLHFSPTKDTTKRNNSHKSTKPADPSFITAYTDSTLKTAYDNSYAGSIWIKIQGTDWTGATAEKDKFTVTKNGADISTTARASATFDGKDNGGWILPLSETGYYEVIGSISTVKTVGFVYAPKTAATLTLTEPATPAETSASFSYASALPENEPLPSNDTEEAPSFGGTLYYKVSLYTGNDWATHAPATKNDIGTANSQPFTYTEGEAGGNVSLTGLTSGTQYVVSAYTEDDAGNQSAVEEFCFLTSPALPEFSLNLITGDEGEIWQIEADAPIPSPFCATFACDILEAEDASFDPADFDELTKKCIMNNDGIAVLDSSFTDVDGKQEAVFYGLITGTTADGTEQNFGVISFTNNVSRIEVFNRIEVIDDMPHADISNLNEGEPTTTAYCFIHDTEWTGEEPELDQITITKKNGDTFDIFDRAIIRGFYEYLPAKSGWLFALSEAGVYEITLTPAETGATPLTREVIVGAVDAGMI